MRARSLACSPRSPRRGGSRKPPRPLVCRSKSPHEYNIAAAGYSDRIEIRDQRVEALTDVERFDLVYLPQVFLSEDAFVRGLATVWRALRPATGKGTNSSTDLYWGKGWYVWNNTGDKAILRDSSSALKDTCSWGDGSGIRYC